MPTISHGEPTPQANSTTPNTTHLVTVKENSTHELWPYMSRHKSFDSATLPINFVVDRNALFVHYLLSETTGTRWNISQSQIAPSQATTTENTSASIESGVVINGTNVEWAGARGSTRYTYMYDHETGTGYWTDETNQLLYGSYFGARQHIRMYEGGSERDKWTAIQVHREHWDWFRLRHTVDSVDRAQYQLEQEFRTSGFVIDRDWFANGGGKYDGWVTSVTIDIQDFGPALTLSGFILVSSLLAAGPPFDITATRVRNHFNNWLANGTSGPQYVLLFSSLAILVFGVRIGAIAVENSYPSISPHIIAVVFYPLLVIGTPAIVLFVARTLEPIESALIAAGGFGTGIAADYAYLNIEVLPLAVILHQATLITIIATIAAGSGSHTQLNSHDTKWYWNETIVVGLLMWIVALLLPLLNIL